LAKMQNSIKETILIGDIFAQIYEYL